MWRKSRAKLFEGVKPLCVACVELHQDVRATPLHCLLKPLQRKLFVTLYIDLQDVNAGYAVFLKILIPNLQWQLPIESFFAA
jgi:hypothetical protein